MEYIYIIWDICMYVCMYDIYNYIYIYIYILHIYIYIYVIYTHILIYMHNYKYIYMHGNIETNIVNTWDIWFRLRL